MNKKRVLILLFLCVLLLVAFRHADNIGEEDALQTLCINKVWDWFVIYDVARIIEEVQIMHFNANYMSCFYLYESIINDGNVYFFKESPYSTFSRYFQLNPQATRHEIVAQVNRGIGNIANILLYYHGEGGVINKPISDAQTSGGINWDWEKFIIYLNEMQPYVFYVMYRTNYGNEWHVFPSRCILATMNVVFPMKRRLCL